MLIKSQIKYIQSLSQKKSREEAGVFIAEGPKLINELLDASNIEPVQIFAEDGWIRNQEASKIGRLPVVPVTTSELERISAQPSPNQVLGLFKEPVFPLPVASGQTFTLLLDTIQDPGNMGSIVRCADWFGLNQVVCSTDSADIFNPKVVQASMGSICRVHVFYTNIEEWVQQQSGIPLFAATLDGEDLNTIGPLKGGIVMIGNESKGIRPSLIKLASKQVTIPRLGKAESLNAAVATGIILSHLVSSNKK